MDMTYGEGHDGHGQSEAEVDEESETLGNKRSRRTSLIGPAGGGAGLETAPLNDMKAASLPDEQGDATNYDGYG
jgi:hypothetical protein